MEQEPDLRQQARLRSKYLKKADNRSKYNHILNDKLYLCARASHLFDLKISKETNEDYFDLAVIKRKKKMKKQLINFLYNTKKYYACDYCNIGTEKEKMIKPGT